MITPSPTTPIDPAVARGTFLTRTPATATSPECLVLGIPNTSYELHLRPTAGVSTPIGKRLLGVIRVEARRIDRPGTGGKFIEPVFGRPRRVQGTVIRIEQGAVVVDAGAPIHLVPLDPRQSPESFTPGELVSCDVMDGATFSPR
ncbi:MAG: hypothetical protein HBSAPP03_21770 [Phycisphaerae bacterium]|nr:MAG: hypothetical protein HBSAPP03_21770 [Phycisphaerae bacterium]